MEKACDDRGSKSYPSVNEGREVGAEVPVLPTGTGTKQRLKGAVKWDWLNAHQATAKKEFPMAYCIMRVEKRKRAALYGLQIEANRTTTDHEKGRDFAASDIKWELTDFNMFLVKSENWGKAVTAALKEAEIQERKNSVVVLDGFYGASPEWFKDKSMDEIVSYFKDCLAFHEQNYGKVINAVIHFDENSPHLSCQSLPLIEGTNGRTRLSARDIMGGRDDYRRRQDLFYEQVGKPRGLERGEVHDPAQTREHLSVQAYKNQQLEKENQQLREESSNLKLQCRVLATQKQQLQDINQALAEQVEQPFLTYCMMEFIRNAKVRGERGEIKLVYDGFQTYMARNMEQLRTKWEQQLLPNYYPPQEQEEERFREREYDYEQDYDDRER